MTLPLWCTAAICCVISKAAAPFLLYPHQQHTHTHSRCTRCSPISLPFPQLLTAPDRTAVWTCCCWERAESAENYHSTRTATMLWYSTTMYCDIIQQHNCTTPRGDGGGGGKRKMKHMTAVTQQLMHSTRMCQDFTLGPFTLSRVWWFTRSPNEIPGLILGGDTNALGDCANQKFGATRCSDPSWNKRGAASRFYKVQRYRKHNIHVAGFLAGL